MDPIKASFSKRPSNDEMNTDSIMSKFSCKGGSAGTGAVKILAMPKKGGGSDPCQDFLVDL